MTIVRAADSASTAAAARRGHRFEVLTPTRPGQRAELSRHMLAAGGRDRRRRRPADARARQPRDRAGRARLAWSSSATGSATRCGEGDCVTFDADLPHHFENPGPDEAALLAVVSAGLRRS